MSKSTPDITFILPIYKTPEAFLTKCVQCVINQTHANIEILLIDDGSPDNCPSVCDNLAKEDTRITVIHQKNAGVGNARNTGLKKAKGTWVCFVDPDDWVSTHMIKTVLESISTDKENYDVVMWNYIKEFGKTSETIRYFQNQEASFSSTKELQKLHELSIELTSGVGSIWAKLYKRDFLLTNNLYSNENLPRGQDVEYNFRIFNTAKAVKFIPDALYHYRYDENTASTAFNTHFKDYLLLFIEALYTDAVSFNNHENLVKKVYIRAIHALLTISLRYTFHKDNPANYSEKIKDFASLCKIEIFKNAIQAASYKDFFLPRKIALWCLKHNVYRGLYLIAKTRQLQYSLKQ